MLKGQTKVRPWTGVSRSGPLVLFSLGGEGEGCEKIKWN